MAHEQANLLCFGLGYCGTVLAQRLLAKGWSVTGTSRREYNSGQSGDLTVIQFPARHRGDTNDRSLQQAIANATHILSTIPTMKTDDSMDGPVDDAAVDPVIEHYAPLLATAPQVRWIGYLSTTGVYGNTDGAMVDEEYATNPTGIRGQRRVAAENQWLDLYSRENMPVHIFRLPGIYGPTRSAFDQLRRGKVRRIHKPGHKFNRVHVDDIAQTVMASMVRPYPGRIYNVCDDRPVEPAHVTAYACEKMGIEPPPMVPFDHARQDMSPMGASFWADNRQVSNARIKDELGVRLKYPDYKSGLDAIWRYEQEQS